MDKNLVNWGQKESGASMQRPMNCEGHRLLIVYVNGVERHIEQREEKRLALFLPAPLRQAKYPLYVYSLRTVKPNG